MSRVRVGMVGNRLPQLRSTLPKLPAPVEGKRTTGRKWTALRRRHLQHEPLCRECKKMGMITAADEVDHIVPISDGGNDAEHNLQSLCFHHHYIKSANESRERNLRVQ